jgi:hypothetical protein
MDCKLYSAISDKVQQQLLSLPSECGRDCPQADYGGCILRAASHDFMGFKGSFGGSDGCFAEDTADNAGLHECLVTGTNGSKLIDVYQEFCNQVSLADFLVISAEAVMMAMRKTALETFVQPIPAKLPPNEWPDDMPYPLGNNLPDSSFSPLGIDFSAGFQFGRATSSSCATCTATTPATTPCAQPLPDPMLGCPENERIFIENMGLTWQETTALMGLRTVGSASPNVSGFNGFTSDAQNSRRWNNNYYISMLMKGWVPQEVPGVPGTIVYNATGSTSKFQWTRSDDFRNPTLTEMMLDTDLCLAYETPLAKAQYDLGKDGNGALSCCNFWKDDNSSLCGNSGYSHSKCCNPNDKMYSNCPNDNQIKSGAGSSGAAVKLYAFNEDQWIKDFVAVWRKATEIGQSGLTPLKDASGQTCNNGVQRDYRQTTV